jgi:tetrahydromethanopterin S-methyltransferase subunit G
MPQTLEERVSYLENMVKTNNYDIQTLSNRLDVLEGMVEKRFESVDRRIESINVRLIDKKFNLVIGVIFFYWITLFVRVLI